MVENLRNLCEYLALEIEGFDPKLLKDNKLEYLSSSLMIIDELPERLNFVHKNFRHDKRYPLVLCKSVHCFECLLVRVKQKVQKCEHGYELSPFEVQHILYMEQVYKVRMQK